MNPQLSLIFKQLNALILGKEAVMKQLLACVLARGHVLLDTAQDVGGYQAVMWDAVNRVWWGGTEMRKDGVALGY